MIRILQLIPIVLSIVVITCPNAFAEISSASYRITSTVISGGSGSVSSANYRLNGTIGQPSPVGSSTSNAFEILPGFWQTLLLVTIGDVNGDGNVDLEDLIIALQVNTGSTAEAVFRSADMDGDGKITLVEAIMLLQKLASP